MQVDVLKGVLEELKGINQVVKDAGDLILSCFREKHKLLVAGNGGSASDSLHLVGELVGNYKHRDRQSLPAIALVENQASITSISNDLGFENLFSRQIEGLGIEGDIFMGISTSGRSRNLLLGLKKAKEKGLSTIGLCGKFTDDMKGLCDVLISIPSGETQRVQECHIFIIHLLCDYIEDRIIKGE